VRAQPSESTLDALEWNFNQGRLRIRRVEIDGVHLSTRD
jgi:hypothetical protein